MKTEGKALESMVSTEGQGITYGEEGEDVGKALLMQEVPQGRHSKLWGTSCNIWRKRMWEQNKTSRETPGICKKQQEGPYGSSKMNKERLGNET